jgi:hypothetical protein
VTRRQRQRSWPGIPDTRGWSADTTIPTPLGVDPIIIECDRCRRPVTSMSLMSDGLGERVVIDTHALPDVYRRQYVQGRVQVWDASAFWEDPSMPMELRYKLVCVGHKHGVNERVVTQGSWTDAYYRARIDGRDRVSMRELYKS